MSSPSQPLQIQAPFVGRKREQQAYRQLLSQTRPWVLIITGQGGNGKSTLLRYLAEQTPQNVPVVTLNFANASLRTDPLKILEELSWKLAAQCAAQDIDTFKKTLTEQRNKLSALSGQMSQTIHVAEAASLQGALESYEQALTLFRQVGDRLGEANCYLAQGRIALEQEDYQKALRLHYNAYQLYQQIQDRYSQARLLYYRSFVYEAMKEQLRAIQDMEKALTIAQPLDLPFIDLFQERLDELRGDSS